MTKINIYIDKRYRKTNGKMSIKFGIHHYKFFYVNSGMEATEKEFNGIEFSGPNAQIKNISLRDKFNKVERFILDLEDKDKLLSYSDKKLKSSIEKLLAGFDTEDTYLKVFDEYIDTMTKENTIELYQQTRKKILDFDPSCNFNTMTKEWLTKFNNHLLDEGLKVNSISIHLRNIRTVFNYALDNEYTELYPFRKFKIKQQETRHRNLTLEQLCAIRDNDCEECQKEDVDFFMLSFYLIGMNPADLLRGNAEIHNDRIEYNRLKTQRYYSIKIEPEAMEILERHPEWIENKMSVSEVRTFIYKVNRGLKKLSYLPVMRSGRGGKKLRMQIEPDLSMYWARHTWATIAASLDVPLETISRALGHASGTVTDVYIAFSRQKVDEANRKVLDFIKKKGDQ